MKTIITISIFLLIITLTLSCITKKSPLNKIEVYTPDDKELYNTIIEMDHQFFEAYNKCDLKKQSLMLSENIEFFHDKAGLSTSKKEILEAIKNNICGKVTRELIKGSIEVYPIKDYGAVQIGFHKFYNNQEPDAISKASKFIGIWKNENENWQMTKIISLH